MRPSLHRLALLGAALLVVSTTACRRDNGVDPDDPGPPDRSMFDTGDELWTIDGDAQRNYAQRPFYRNTGGNPGGFVYAVDDAQADAWYFVAPQKFRGSRETYYGKTLTFDLFQSDTIDQDTPRKGVVLSGTSSAIAFDFPRRPGKTWTRFSVPFSAGAGWYDTTTRQPVTEAQMRAVLSNIREFRIRGEFKMDADSGGLDNVEFVTGTAP